MTRLHAEVSRVTRLPELRKRYIERGIELVASASPDAFTTYIKVEFDKKAKLAREAGIRIEGGLGVAVTRRMTISRYKT